MKLASHSALFLLNVLILIAFQFQLIAAALLLAVVSAAPQIRQQEKRPVAILRSTSEQNADGSYSYR